MSNDTSAQSSSANSLQKLDVKNERDGFEDWETRAHVLFNSKGWLDVVTKPVFSIPLTRDDPFEEDPDLDYIGKGMSENAIKLRAKLIDNSKKAFQCITDSLANKHLEIVRSTNPDNAYALMKQLRATFGILKTAVSTHASMTKLTDNRRITGPPLESMNDYLTRTERFFHEYSSLNETPLPLKQKKFYLLRGLSDLPSWKQTLISFGQIDMNQNHSLAETKAYLLDQEEMKRLAQSDTSNHHDSHNNNNSNKAFYSNRGHFRGRGRSRGRAHFHYSNRGGQHSSPHYQQQHDNSRGRGIPRGRGRGSFRGMRGNTNHNNHHHNNHQQHSNVTCFTCGKPGHISTECLSGIRCHNCGRFGHKASECYSKKRSFDNNNNSQANASSSSSYNDNDETFLDTASKRRRALVTITSSSPSTAFHTITTNKHDWILDSGATDHYVSDSSLMHDVTHLSTPRNIITANGVSTCNTVGKVIIDAGKEEIELKNVLFLPDFHANLISVSRIASPSVDVLFKQDRALIIIDNIVTYTFPRINDIYVLTSQNQQ
jgi:hypothetical protein